MPTPLNPPTTVPKNVIALRTLLLHREDEHAAELERSVADLTAARHGLQAQVLRNEQLKLRLARLLRERFGASSEEAAGEIEQLELLLGELEERLAEAMPPEPDEAAAPPETEAPASQAGAQAAAGDAAARRRGACSALCLSQMWWRAESAGRRRDRGIGLRAGLVPRHPPCAAEASCRGCESIAQAPAPSLPIHRGLASPALLAHVLVAKYCDRLPLYRQAEIYARAGVELNRSTMADWVEQTARLMRPLVEAVGRHVMSAERVHGDDTTVRVLDPGRGKTKTGRLWCYARDDGPFGGKAPPAVLYCYSPDRKGEHPRAHLTRSTASCRRMVMPDTPACTSVVGTRQPA